MEKFYVGMDWEGYDHKPQNIARVKQNATEEYHDFTIEEIAEYVGNEGHGIVPALLEGGMKTENFRSIQLFLLDFDGAKYNEKTGKTEGIDLSFDQIQERAKGADLPIAFAYRTFSCPDQPPFLKLRVAFVHEFPIADKNLARLVYCELAAIFPECDHACTELFRLFLGGKGLIYSDPEARFNLVQLTHRCYPFLNRGRHLDRNLITLSKKCGIEIIDGRIAVGTLDMIADFGADSNDSCVHIIAETLSAPIFYIQRYPETFPDGEMVKHHKETCKKQHQRQIDIHAHPGACKLLDDFFACEPLNHNQRFLLATNLANIKGGLKEFLSIMHKFYSEESEEKWTRDSIQTIRRYKPMSCSDSYCPYYEECMSDSYSKNIVTRLANDRRIIPLEAKKYTSIKEAENSLSDNLSRAIASAQEGIHLIRAQTAIGKTTQIIRLIQANPDKRFLIAEPLCSMKKEVFDELSRIYDTSAVKMTISVRDSSFLEDNDIRAYISAHDAGNHREAKHMIREKLEWYKKERPYAVAAIQELQLILEGMHACDDPQIHCVVTTHAMLLNTPESILSTFDEIIIDEDILYLQAFSTTRKVSRARLHMVEQSNKPWYSDIAKYILQRCDERIHKLPFDYGSIPEWSEICQGSQKDEYADEELLYEENETKGNGICADNISDLAHAVSFVSDGEGIVHYFCKCHLPRRKYIVLSATLNATIYKDYFSDVMPIHEYPFVSAAYTGSLTQFTFHSLGRRDLSKKQRIYDFAKDYSGNPDINMITFKKEEQNRIINNNNLHFGNSVGVNCIKGEDLVVIGTPYKHPYAYLLPCCYLYGEDVVNNDKMIRQRVEYNGFSFLSMSYSSPQLKSFLMYSLESELEQCIGRARLLRFDCHVYLFSSFPCEQARLITTDYLTDHSDEDATDSCDKTSGTKRKAGQAVKPDPSTK